MTLTEFLLARYAERADEAWEVHNRYCEALAQTPFPCDCGEPERVMTDIEAKRQIVELHYEIRASDIDWSDCHTCPTRLTGTRWPCPTLRALAAVYADHPDYHDEWRA